MPKREQSVPDSPQNPIQKALALNPAFARAASTIALVEAGNQIYQRTKNWYASKVSYSVKIEEGDSVFLDVHDWLMSVIPSVEHRDLKIWSGEDRNSYGEVSLASNEPKVREPIRVVIDDSSEHRFDIENHKVKVSISKPDNSSVSQREFRQRQHITFSCRSQDAQQAVIRKVESLRKARAERKPVLQMATSWGSWQRRSDLPTRDLDSVILPVKQKQRIVSDLEQFYADEDKYNALGIPYHRSYVFHGPPGTGKTSLAKGLATFFHRDFYYIPLGELREADSLLRLISDVGASGMLLLEDIHTVKAKTDGTDGVNLESVLSGLDGVATPHGLVTIITANRFDDLDPALVRAGRMDVVEHIGLPSPEVVRDMFLHFYGEHPDDMPDLQISQAEIAEVFKRNFNDPERAFFMLCNLAGERAGVVA